MNYLYVSKSELSSDAHVEMGQLVEAVMAGERAKEAIHDHKLRSGLSISCVLEGSGRGKVEIINCGKEEIHLRLRLEEALPERLPLHLVVAYSRPQTLKKVFQLSASLGVKSLSLVKTSNVVPSYLQSKGLEKAEVERQLRLGCEQAGDGNFPQINHYPKFHEFIKSPQVTKFEGSKYFGDIGPFIRAAEGCGESILFLGPESGFTNEEKSALQVAGFSVLSLGPRVLRVENAAAMLLGMLAS